MSRLTRQEMKRDEVREFLSRAMLWIGDNLKTIAAAVAVFVVAIVAVTMIRGFLGGRQEGASDALSDAISVLSTPLESELSAGVASNEEVFSDEAARRTAALAAFSAIVEEYPRAPSARIARSYVGKLELESGNREASRQAWNAVLEAGGGDALAAEVELNLIHLDREDGLNEEVEQRLQSALGGASSSLPEDALLYELAITQERLGKIEESLVSLRRLLDEHPTSPYSAEARRKTLGAQA